ncbi:hypothetical protein TWF481_008558 [Arthrobotrys musiformis]|uniref:F-box domain-containing protein n=1 Tax=Arthrobotrys musiformis TaxID=47236 RepID=A0AAV9W9J5_9PEZI
MDRVFAIREIFEAIMLFYLCGHDDPGKHTFTNCKLVNRSWNKLISESARLRYWVGEFTYYFPRGKVGDEAPFIALEQYLNYKWARFQRSIPKRRRKGQPKFDANPIAKSLVPKYFWSGSGPEDKTPVFQAGFQVQFLRVTVFGYHYESMVLAKDIIHGNENITVSRLEKIVHDSLLSQDYNIVNADSRLCIQFSWMPPIPCKRSFHDAELGPPRSYSVRVIVLTYREFY